MQVDSDRDSEYGDSLRSSPHLLRKQGILTANEEKESEVEALRRQLYKCQQDAIKLTEQNKMLAESKKELFVMNNEKDKIIKDLKSKILQNELVDESKIEKPLVVMPSKPATPLPPPASPPPPAVISPTFILCADSSEKDKVAVSAASTSPRTQQTSKTSKTQSRRSGRRAAEEGDGIDGVRQVSTTIERPGAQLTQQGRSRVSGGKNIVQSVKGTVKSISSRKTGKTDRRSAKEVEADKATELTAPSKGAAEPAAPRILKDIEAGKAAELTASSERFGAAEAAESDRRRNSVKARKSRVLQTGEKAAATNAAGSGRKVKSAVPRGSKEIEHERTTKFESSSEEAKTEDFMAVGPQALLETVTDKSVNLAVLTKRFEKTGPERSEKSTIESDSIKSEPDKKDRCVAFDVMFDAFRKLTALVAEKSPRVVDEDLGSEFQKNLSGDGEFETAKESRKGSDAVHGKDVQPEGNISPDFVKRPSGKNSTETAKRATQPSAGDSGEEEDESLSKLGIWVELQEIEGEKQLEQQREDAESHKLGIVHDGARDSRNEVRQSVTRHSLEFVDGQSEFGQGAFQPVSAGVARLCTRGGLGLPLGRLAQKSFTQDSVDFEPQLIYLDTIEGVQGRPVAGLQRESEKQRRMSISTSSLKTGMAFRASERWSSENGEEEGHAVVSHPEECLLLRGIGLPSRPSLLHRLVRTADVLRGPLDPEFDRGGHQGLLREDLDFKRTSKGLYQMEHSPGNTESRPSILSALPHTTLQPATGKLLPLQPMTPDYMAALKSLRVIGSTVTTVPGASSDTKMLESAGDYHPPMTSKTLEAISSILRAYNIDLNDPATLEQQLECIKMSGSMSGLKEAIELLAPYVKLLSEDVEVEEKNLLVEAVQALQKRFAELVTQGLQTGFRPVSIELPVLSSKAVTFTTDRQRKIHRSHVRQNSSTQHQARGLVQLRPILSCEEEFIRYRKILEENADLLQAKDKRYCPSYKAYVQYKQSLSQASLQHSTMDSLTRTICCRPLTN